MGDLKPHYHADIAEMDWDALVRSHEIGRMVQPNYAINLILPASSADDLMRILKQRDRVRVVEIERQAEPGWFHAVVLGLLSYGALAQAAKLVLAVLS